MHLLSTTESDAGNFEVQDFSDDDIPPYAILSHTWDKEEVTFQDMQGTRAANKKGYEKIRICCSVAKANRFKHVWIDTCCIDKTSSVELSEAINSMYRWYQEAKVCYAYLSDVQSKSEISNSRWFTRGWTLQELIAPSEVIFFDKEWKVLGTKTSLRQGISDCTRIPIAILSGDDDLENAGIAQKMSWAANRKTSRLEDRAYCLMGIFGINMPLLYGEGERAFVRLQEEIIKVSDDHSIFAWRSKDQNHGGLLATSPDAFEESTDITFRHSPSITSNGPWTVTNKGIHLELSFIAIGHRGLGLAILPCTKLGREDLLLGIFLRDVSLTMERFERVFCGKFELVSLRRFQRPQYPTRQICVRQRLLAIARTPKGQKEHGLNSVRTKEHGYAHMAARPDSNWELFDGRLTNFADVMEPTALLPTPQGGVNDLADKDGRTALSRAAGSGRVEEVRPLLAQRNIRTDSKDKHKRTPLSHAAGGGHAKVVWLLLARPHIMANSKDKYERTPLSYAAQGGHNDVVWLLLARSDIKPDIRDISDRTPLSYAAKGGHEAVIKMLLKASADVESKDENGRTPLSWAAENGHEAVVRLLLDKGAEIESKKDGYGRTPLSWAAGSGHEAVVKLLLDKGAVIDSKGRHVRKGVSYDRTPLSWAAESGHEAVVKLLLDKGADIDSKGKYGRKGVDCGRTPLSWAAGSGHETVVKLLLETGKVDVDSKDNQYSQTPLSWAAKKGHKAVVRLLLETGKVDVDSKEDKYSRTPLLLAVEKGHEAVVRLLLETGKVDVNSKEDQYGETPLSLATGNGDDAMVRLLLETGKVDVNSKDDYG